MAEKLTTKEVEAILKADIENWMAWGRRRDFMPTSFKCVLGAIRIHERIPLGDDRYDPFLRPVQRPSEHSAANFERVVINLPDRHKKAFVMYHLGKCCDAGRIRKVRSREDMASQLGVQLRMLDYITNAAHNIVLREWLKIIAKTG